MRIQNTELNKIVNAVKENGAENGLRFADLMRITRIGPGPLYYRIMMLEISGRLKISRPYPGVTIIYPGGDV